MWIYKHKDWPKFRWNDSKLMTKLAELRYMQGRLLGKIEELGIELKQDACLKIITTDIIKSSAIEGEKLNNDEVRSSVARRLGIDIGGYVPASRDVEGIAEMMIDASQNFNQPLTEQRLFNWHATLFPTGRSGMEFIIVGHWRSDSKGPMQVISGPIGREKVHFEAPPAKSLNKEIKKFLKWFEEDCKKQNIDPVIKSGIAHFWFVTLHPFEDGNGRIARAVADLALARADGIKNRYYSISTQIALDRNNYYKKLMQQQSGSLDLTEWLEWYLKCMQRALINSEETLANIYYKNQVWKKLLKHNVNERQKIIISKMLDDFKGYMTTSKYAKIAKCSNDSALRDIQDLNQIGILIKNESGGRSTSYRLLDYSSKLN